MNNLIHVTRAIPQELDPIVIGQREVKERLIN